MRFTIGLWFCAFVSLSASSAQPSVPLPLSVKKEVVVRPSQGGILMIPVKCDARGNVYLRGYVAQDVMAAPVARVSPEGDKITAFDIRTVPGFERAEAEDFAVGPRGEVYVLAYKTVEARAIVRFRDSGQFDTTTKLEHAFDPGKLAVFATGEFLVSGTRHESAKDDAPGKPFTGLFDRSGKLLKEIVLRDDFREIPAKKDEPKQSVSAEKPSDADRPEDDDPNAPLSLGSAEGADDGQVYLFRAADPPFVYVLSSSGEVVRRMEFTPPEEGFRAVTMKVTGGRIAIQFEEAKPPRDKLARQIITVFDATLGEKLADYLSSEKIGGAFACFTSAEFLFVGTNPNRNFTIQIATPR